MSDVVMSGTLGAFDIPAILQAMSLSRQYTRLRLWSDLNDKTGEIRMKAGQILQAESSTLIGRDAFVAILEGAHATFCVERCQDPEHFGAPLGTIGALLLSAKREAPAPARRRVDRTEESLTFSPMLTDSMVIDEEPVVPKPASAMPGATTPPPVPESKRLSAKAPGHVVPTSRGLSANASPANVAPTRVPPAPLPHSQAPPKPPAHPPQAFHAGFADRFRGFEGLRLLILADLGSHESTQYQWQRNGSESVDSDNAMTLLEALGVVNQDHGRQDANARVSLELADSIIVGQCLPGDKAFVCGFDPVLPLGVVRHICKTLEPELLRYLQAASKSSKLAG